MFHIVFDAKATTRNLTLTRSQRDEPLGFRILGGCKKGSGIFISEVKKKTVEKAGLKRGDQILRVNNHRCDLMTLQDVFDTVRRSTHLSITVKSNLKGKPPISFASL